MKNNKGNMESRKPVPQSGTNLRNSRLHVRRGDMEAGLVHYFRVVNELVSTNAASRSSLSWSLPFALLARR